MAQNRCKYIHWQLGGSLQAMVLVELAELTPLRTENWQLATGN
jgi:hypothetical protein